MIERRTGNVVEAQAEAVVNTVNCAGVMGKGIALLVKQAYPKVFKDYRAACKRGEVQPGRMLTLPAGPVRATRKRAGLAPAAASVPAKGPRYIINFPTKRHWRQPSRMDDIRAGLPALIAEVRKLGVQSVAVPALGCGNGGLDWEQVRPLIIAAFAELPNVTVYLYDPHAEPAPGDDGGTPAADDTRVILPAAAALVTVAAAYAAEGYRLGEREMELLAELLACKLSGPAAPRETPWWLLPAEHEGAPALAVAPEAVRMAAAVLQQHRAAAAAAADTVALIERWETPYSLELLATVHRLASADPSAGTGTLLHADGWPEPVRHLLRPRHIELARKHLLDHGRLSAVQLRLTG